MSLELNTHYLNSQVPDGLRDAVFGAAAAAAHIPDDEARRKHVESQPAELQAHVLSCLPLDLRYDLTDASVTDVGNTPTPAKVDQLAAACYSEYCNAVGGKAYDGKPLPHWRDFAADESKAAQANGWRAVAKYVLAKALIALMLAVGLAAVLGTTGCATTGVGNTESPTSTIASYAVDAEDAARLGTAVYLIERERLDPDRREAARLAYLAFDDIVKSAAVAGVAVPNIRAYLATELAASIVDPRYRPFVQQLANLVLRRLEARIPIDQLDSAAVWPVLVGLHDGIAAVLADAGIDPTIPVQGP